MTNPAAPSTSADTATATEGGISYSLMHAPDPQQEPRVDHNQPKWLRAFEDGYGVMRAGLYDSPQPDQNDHWAEGEILTDELDAAMVTEALKDTLRSPAFLGCPTEPIENALLGLAYARLEQNTNRPLNVNVPTKLETWTVRVATDTGYERTHVRATDDEIATTIAAVLMFHKVLSNAKVSFAP